MSLHKSIIKVRVELQGRSLKKSGKNKFAGFEYFELSDFLPTLNELMLENEMNDRFSIDDTSASLTLIREEERETYTIPFTHFTTPLNKAGNSSMQDIQYLGALITYYKRYLYMNAFGITDGEVVDAMEMGTPPPPQFATENQVLEITKLLSDKKTDVPTFLDYFKVKTIQELSSSNAVSAIAILNKKKASL